MGIRVVSTSKDHDKEYMRYQVTDTQKLLHVNAMTPVLEILLTFPELFNYIH